MQKRCDGGRRQQCKDSQKRNVTWAECTLQALGWLGVRPKRFGGGKRQQSKGMLGRSIIYSLMIEVLVACRETKEQYTEKKNPAEYDEMTVQYSGIYV
jgi:hypothetical protein